VEKQLFSFVDSSMLQIIGLFSFKEVFILDLAILGPNILVAIIGGGSKGTISILNFGVIFIMNSLSYYQQFYSSVNSFTQLMKITYESEMISSFVGRLLPKHVTKFINSRCLMH